MPSDNGSEWLTTWQENTSGFDRVKSVTMTLMKPETVSWIAEEAAVSSSIARAHLDRLIDLGVVMDENDDGVRHYYPDPLYTQLRDLHELRDSTTKQQRSELTAELRDEVATWQANYDADSPDALRERAAGGDLSADHSYELVRIASDWAYVQYQISLMQHLKLVN